jgi:antirestriction protein ArdC
MTGTQVRNRGGFVRRNSRPTPVVFWNWVEKRESDSEEVETYPILRYHEVYNLEQCYLPRRNWLRPRTGPEPFQGIAVCEQVVEGMPRRPEVQHGGNRAFYDPRRDVVGMPNKEAFRDSESYYGTLFHELVHSTGHSTRLNRGFASSPLSFDLKSYSREELVAEMGAAFLCAECGIDNRTIEPSASYIAGWLEQLGNDKRLVVQAGTAAQRAADFILHRTSARQVAV